MHEYNVEIQYIRGKTNSTCPLSRQLLREAAMRKDQFNEENEQFIEKLGITSDATDEEIKDDLQIYVYLQKSLAIYF